MSTIHDRIAKAGIPGQVTTAFALLAVAALGTVTLAPRLAHSSGASDHPSYAVVAITGEILIVLTACFLAFARKHLGMPTTWLLFAVLYNAAVIVAKFILGPRGIYETTFQLGGLLGPPDYNRPGQLASAGWFTLVLYVLVFGAVHAFFRGRAQRKLGVGRRFSVVAKVLITILSVVVLVPTLVVTLFAMQAYSDAVSAVTGIALTLCLWLAFGGSVGAMRTAATQAVDMRCIAMLTSVFWVGLALLVLYQALWGIYMGILISAWPLKTVQSSGK